MPHTNLQKLIKIDNSLDGEFTIQNLETVSKAIKELRRILICDFTDNGITLIAETHYVLAITALESAEQQMRLAHYHQLKGE